MLRQTRQGPTPIIDPATDPECGIWEGEKPYKRYDGAGFEEHWSKENFPGQWGEANVREGQIQAWSPDLDDFESIDPATEGEFEVTFADGSKHIAIPVWQKFAERCAEYAPEKSEAITGVPAEKVTEAAMVYGTRVDPRWGNGGIMYQLAVEHHGNAIMNCRAIELLTAITGNTDGPGGQRGSTNDRRHLHGLVRQPSPIASSGQSEVPSGNHGKTAGSRHSSAFRVVGELGKCQYRLGSRCYRQAVPGKGVRLPVR